MSGMTDARALDVLRVVTNRAMQGSETREAYDHIAARLRVEADRIPSYEALLIIVQSVCGSLERAWLTDCDDPGEAIDVMRERLEAALSSTAAPAPVADDAVAKLPVQWRHNAQGCGRKDQHAAGTWRSCARDLTAALAQDRASQAGAPSEPVGVEVKVLARDVHYAIRDAGLAPESPADDAAMRDAILRTLAQAAAPTPAAEREVG